MSIKASLKDPYKLLWNWDETSVDPCSWTFITCSSEDNVTGLLAPSKNLSGTLSPSIGNLTNLQNLLLQNNNIAGPLPSEIGRLAKLQTLDLSNNNFTGEAPESIGNLKSLKYLRKVDTQGTGLDRTLCKLPRELFFAADKGSRHKSHKVALALGISLGGVCLLVFGFVLLLWWRQRYNQQIFFDMNGQKREEVCLGNLRRFQFRELQIATDNFSSKNLIGKGGFGNVYKGYLQDGTVVAVKRLKDGNAVGGDVQFQTEVEMIGLAVHRNLLRLYGFCLTATERLLVYPYMSNGSVASRLKGYNNTQISLSPFFELTTCTIVKHVSSHVCFFSECSKTITGLGNKEENCPGSCKGPPIIHRDVKAANILLDEYCEAVVGDFGLAKLLDHRDSHVTTAVRGTVGHIAPEYLSTGQSSEKTDVFGFGILLLELITGQRAVDFGKAAGQKGGMLDWVKKIHQEKKADAVVDKDLRNNYDRVELEEMVQVALLCTQYLPGQRPKMSEVLRMLEGDGLAEKWEASQKADAQKCRAHEFSSSERYSDLTDDSSLLVQAMELSGPRLNADSLYNDS
ncbi:Protein NSP-INTERACTING KINASE 2 [Asimina triloba]